VLNKKNSVLKCLLLLPVFLAFGCSSHKPPLTADHQGVFAKTAASGQNNGEDALDPLALPDKTKGEGMNNGAAASSSNDKHDNVAKNEGGDENQNLLDAALELTETSQEYWADGEVEDAIAALDEAYALILRAETDDTAKLAQQKEDLRFVISKRIMEIYASRQVAVKGNHNAIPMTMNDHVEREIKQFQTVERDFFIESYRRSGRYRQEMVTALKEAGIPEEISWLPLIESGFKVRALSRSRALGLWQFIPSTGYKFGLKRNNWIDERLDPSKSTAAAIAYLKELHQIFGDWATVLAAYNCGEGSVARVIREQKISYLDNFWDLYERLPRETARYFPRFLAVLTILKDPGQYGFTFTELDQPMPYETATVARTIHLKSAADKLNISAEELSLLNPELRQAATPDVAYALRVPVGKKEELLACLDSMPKWSPPKSSYVFHRVRRGETLSLIALRYRTSIQRIMESNRMMRGHYIRVGQRLRIPLRAAT
jgi:membrane-bound lytic murein transglycosylase D